MRLLPSTSQIETAALNITNYRVVKGGGSRSRFMENRVVLLQFTKNKIGFRASQKKRRMVFFKQKLHTYLGNFKHHVDALPSFWTK